MKGVSCRLAVGPRGKRFALNRLIRHMPGSGSHYRDRIQTRPGPNGTIISSEHLCRDWNEGIRGSRAARLEFWGSSAYADRCRNTFSACALGSEEASLAAADLVRRPDGHLDGVPRLPANDRHDH